MGYVEPPTRAEAAADEAPPLGTRRVCQFCGETPEMARVVGGYCRGRSPLRGHVFADFPVCSYCRGAGGRVKHRAGDSLPDPQTAEECPRCEGLGVEGLL